MVSTAKITLSTEALTMSMSAVRQVLGEREAEVRATQEQSSRMQLEMGRMRQELHERATNEDSLKQQLADKEEKTRKALTGAKQKINQLAGKATL